MLKDLGSVGKAMQIVQKYCRGSGAKVNEDQTVYMRFGRVALLTQTFTFKETKEIKILGVLMGRDEKKAGETMWEEALEGIERRLTFWK